MNRKPARSVGKIPASLIRRVCSQLADNKRIRRTLPLEGRVHIDRQLPFLAVYRQPVGRADPGTGRLVVAEASYLIASGDRRMRSSLVELTAGIVETLTEQFGAFLLIEIWAAADESNGEATGAMPPRPGFRIAAPRRKRLRGIVDELETQLARVRIAKRRAGVSVAMGGKLAPPGMSPILTASLARQLGCDVLGIEVQPIYSDLQAGEEFPLIRRAMVRQLGRALKHAFFAYSRDYTTHRPAHFHSLGRRAMVKAVWEVDRRLSEVSSAFDLLLQVTPVNGAAAWSRFRSSRHESPPVFYYRPRPFDPSQLKRRLWDVPIERLEDPTLGELFREKRRELDAQLSMLACLDTRRFLYSSLALFGEVDDGLLAAAIDLLSQVGSGGRERSSGGYLDAVSFAARAEEEIARYREVLPGLTAAVHIRPDTTGLMVSRGDLLVSQSTRIPASRVEALIQHEVGTHVLTYHNGREQPFRQLYSGLSGYEELQEGLAVFAEYLAGGLSRNRLRTLAGRVVAVRRLVEGASFIETFRELNRECGFSQQAAFSIATRVYRGGGLTKDRVYLAGLVSLLAYVERGGDLEPLFVGKIAMDHIPIIEELLLRRVLKPAPLRPQYMVSPEAATRLQRARQGLTVLDLVNWRKT